MLGQIIPNMWEGGECWIIGGGPSMPRQFGVPEDIINTVQNGESSLEAYSPYLSAIHGRHVIAVNMAFRLGRWVDIMLYGDGKFYWDNWQDLLHFPNQKYTCNPNTAPGKPGVYNVKYVARDGGHPMGITKKKDMVSWNKHTGGAAINVAYHLGVKRILLLGFDMKLAENGKQHWHGLYASAKNPRPTRALPFSRHLPSFKYISQDAKRLGLEILNVSPDSAILELKKVELKDVL